MRREYKPWAKLEKRNHLFVFLFGFFAFRDQRDLHICVCAFNVAIVHGLFVVRRQTPTNFFLFQNCYLALQSLCQVAQSFQHLSTRVDVVHIWRCRQAITHFSKGYINYRKRLWVWERGHIN